MTNLKTTLVLCFMAFLSLQISAQNIVLINGEPTEVILDGTEIKRVTDNDVSTSMSGIDTSEPEEFKQKAYYPIDKILASDTKIKPQPFNTDDIVSARFYITD